MKETQPLVKNGTVLELPARRVPTEAQRKASPRQVEASRRNARRSTGPRSMRGKAASSMNAIKHGVFAREAVLRTKLADESRDEFERMLERFRESFAPKDAFERMLVDKMVRALWRLRRLHRFERALAEEDLHRFETSPFMEERGGRVDEEAERIAARRGMPPEEKLVNILRYAAALEREWTRCYAMLEHRKQQAARGEDAPPLYLSLRL
ncbi:MAG: hypothetical protein JSV08_08925 [Acidobacteriota bacterium]|nr:MAG: hypothetical protein JSV08_08925 [Acidobacteriota bacterium]